MAARESQASEEFIQSALDILRREGPMTFRQLFYRLLSAGQIDNTLEDYERASEIMAKLIEDGRCPFIWILGRSRPSLTINDKPQC